MVDEAAPSDEDLMARYVEGDQSAFRLLFDRYSSRLQRLGLRNGLDPATSADLVQQTFLQLHRARLDFDRERRFSPYLFAITLNLIRSTYRTRGRRPEVLLPSDELPESGLPSEGTGPDRIERAQTAALVRDALASLPDNQREVIELHWFQELPFEAVAQTVGASLSAVKVRAHRGYKSLKTLLERGPARE